MTTAQPNQSAAKEKGLIEDQAHLNRQQCLPCLQSDTINQKFGYQQFRNTSTSFRPNQQNQPTISQSQTNQSDVEIKIDLNQRLKWTSVNITEMEIQSAEKMLEWAKTFLSMAVADHKRYKRFLKESQTTWQNSIAVNSQDEQVQNLSDIFFERIKRDEQKIKKAEKQLKKCLDDVVKAVNKLTALQQAKVQIMP